MPMKARSPKLLACLFPPFLKNQRDFHAELEKSVFDEEYTKGKSIIEFQNVKYLIQTFFFKKQTNSYLLTFKTKQPRTNNIEMFTKYNKWHFQL